MMKVRFYIAVLLLFPVAALGDSTKNILILHEGSREIPYQAIVSRALHNDIQSDQRVRAEIFEEYLDIWRLNADFSRSAAMLEAKYTGRRFDVVVSDGPNALLLLLNRPPAFLSDTPVVFLTVDDFTVPPVLPPNFTGIAGHADYAGTIQVARALQPDLQHVYYIDSDPPSDIVRSERARREFHQVGGQTELSVWLRDDLESLLKKVSGLPPHSAVLFDAYFEDPSGKAYIPTQVSGQVAAFANAPVYTLYQNLIGTGTLGGAVVDFEASAHQASRIILGLLHGASIAAFPIERSQSYVAIDWRQFQKLGLPEGRIPRGALVYFREPTLWMRYRWYLISGGLIILLQTLLIVKLGIEGKRRKQSERSTRELAGRLIHAQEQERRRIAAELHDDVCQRLALVCLQLDTMRAAPEKFQAALVDKLSALYDETDIISSDLHQFSRELHPATLERLGLTAALRRFCTEFTVHRKIVVNFRSSGDEAAIDQEVALVLFRVGQECLMNISKHSGAESCDVSLRFGHGRLVLEVRDTGHGFEPDELNGHTGLGLESMRERLRSVSGKLRITSARHRGTRVYAEVPLNGTAPPDMPVQDGRPDVQVG